LGCLVDNLPPFKLIIPLGKPPALPGDFQSLTIPGTSTPNQIYKKEAATVDVMEIWRNQIPLNPPLKRGGQEGFNQGFLFAIRPL
jgi:hypothetical protein